MVLDFAARVDIGTRETNDDRVLINGTVVDSGIVSGETCIPSVAVVCDGCGGYLGGNIAAQMVLERIASEDPASLSDAEHLREVLYDCQRIVMERKADTPALAEMCTTVAGCVFGEDSLRFFHSGDSRIYRYDRWGLARMTKDHSAVQEMIDSREISQEEAETHPNRNIISRCIGMESLPPDIYAVKTAICPGEKYLICSDGLWESIKDTEMKGLLDEGLSLEDTADILVRKALEYGSDDNISVCLCAARSDDKD
jgi:protein phosphatase